jgi:hypothetical protein
VSADRTPRNAIGRFFPKDVETLLGEIAAIDDELGAGDERGFVGGEEQHPVGDDVFMRADPD